MLKPLNHFWSHYGLTKPLILASSSPRRAALLQALHFSFEVVDPAIGEGEYGPWDGGELLRQRAVQKLRAVAERFSGRALLAADTVVVLGSRVFGKPAHEAEAREMLSQLSGRRHEVWSSLSYQGEHALAEKTSSCRTRVTFRKMSADEIDAYLATGESLDKAGAYGIQGLGGLWVKNLQGCYFNVVGLPLSQLLDVMRGE